MIMRATNIVLPVRAALWVPTDVMMVVADSLPTLSELALLTRLVKVLCSTLAGKASLVIESTTASKILAIKIGVCGLARDLRRTASLSATARVDIGIN